MIWFGKSFIEFCKSFINLIKLVSTRTCSSARVRGYTIAKITAHTPGPHIMILGQMEVAGLCQEMKHSQQVIARFSTDKISPLTRSGAQVLFTLSVVSRFSLIFFNSGKT